MAFKENRIDSKDMYIGKIITVKLDNITIESDQGVKYAKREVVYHPVGACALIKTRDGKIKFVTQYRYPFQDFLLELPAGKRDINEEPLKTITREVEEECGIKPLEITDMGKLYLSPGISNEVIYLYYIDKYEVTKQHFDEDEFLDISEYTYEESLKMIENGKLCDAKSIALILKCRKYFI